MVYVKICGITELSSMEACIKYGANAMGFVVGVPESPRNLTEFQALDLIRLAPRSVQTVVVTSVYSCHEVEYLAARFPNSYIQVHLRCRQPRFEDLGTLNLERIIPAITAQAVISLNVDLPVFQKIFQRIPYLLVDGSMGTGRAENVKMASRAVMHVHPCKVVLAGGLNANNLKSMLQAVRPYGVDVSSGVEQAPGIKSIERIKSFLSIAKCFEEKSLGVDDTTQNAKYSNEVKTHG